jgi:hypothetical protein
MSGDISRGFRFVPTLYLTSILEPREADDTYDSLLG